ncbi:hypothetical protein [Roseibium alexandrii]|uniref:hypothetical protein n=1 Tax=Roseibium alexandrii TaxID=388408 RepID=UPI0037531F2A
MGFTNSPAAEAFLVKGKKYDFGDYLRFQIDRQMYPFMTQLNDALEGTLEEEQVASYEDWFSDAQEAELYSQSQHAGSLGPGRSLAKLVDLSSVRKLLDIGGGQARFPFRFAKPIPGWVLQFWTFRTLLRSEKVLLKQKAWKTGSRINLEMH